MDVKAEIKPPIAGKLGLQVERGVATTIWQLLSKEDRMNDKGSSRMENIPDALVVTLETTFPLQRSCTSASVVKKLQG